MTARSMKFLLVAIGALLLAAPGLGLLANLVWFTYTGVGFLPPDMTKDNDLNMLRLVVIVLSGFATAIFVSDWK